jgi:hypothetical protein
MRKEAEVRIARSSDGHIYITVEDRDSHTLVAEVRMTPEAFGQAITNLAVGYDGTVTYVHGDLSNVGKVRENKTMILPLEELKTKKHSRATKEEIIEFLKPYEVDGWRGRYADVLNSRNQDHRKGTVAVGFTRLVDKSAD